MATRRGPRFKECRRFGINVCGHPKALDRLGTTVKRSKKMSEYGKQLLEKQKIKAYTIKLQVKVRHVRQTLYSAHWNAV